MNALFALLGRHRGGPPDVELERHRALVLERLTELHGDAGLLVDGYTGVAGDGFQARFRDSADLPRVLWDLASHFQPVQVTVGVGIGADGEVYQRAQSGLARLGGGRTMFSVCGPDPVIEAALNASLRLLGRHLAQITPNQWRVIEACERHGRQGQAAAALGRAASTVSRALAAAGYGDIRASLGDLEQYLKNCIEKDKTNKLHSEEHLWL